MFNCFSCLLVGVWDYDGMFTFSFLSLFFGFFFSLPFPSFFFFLGGGGEKVRASLVFGFFILRREHFPHPTLPYSFGDGWALLLRE